VEGLGPDDDVALIVIDAKKGMQPLFTSQQGAKAVLEMLSGTASATGFDIPYPAQLENPPKESYGIAVVVGKGPFSIDMFGDPSKSEPAVPLDAGWPDRFRAAARANGWRTDIFWFSVADNVPG
jgi:hypothetical protein